MLTDPTICLHIATERQDMWRREATQDRLARQYQATRTPPRLRLLFACTRAMAWLGARRIAPSHAPGR